MGISVDPQEPATRHSVVESSEFDVILEKSSQKNEEGIVITYDLVSREDCAVAIACMDTLPVSEPDAIGFHPEHAPQTWDTWGDDISIVHELPPAASATFELGIVADAVHCSEEDPIFQSIERLSNPSNTVEDESGRGDHSIERTPVADAEDTSPGQRNEFEDPDPVPSESTPREENDVGRDGPYPEKTATDNLIEVLLRELGESDESGELAERLREALAPEPSRSEQVRLRHVQSTIDDLSAYTATLEAFIDEYDALPRWAKTTEERLESVEAKTTEAQTDANALSEQLARLEADMQEFSASQTALSQQLESTEESIASLETSVAQITNEVDDRSDVAARLEAVESVFAGIEDALTSATLQGVDGQ